MQTLILGASGSIGRHLGNHLLQKGEKVKAFVRSPEKMPEEWQQNRNLDLIKASISELSVEEMTEYVSDCQAVACCLGHRMTFKGIWGHPQKLVTDAVRLTCQAINNKAGSAKVKFVLMNTVGNRNSDADDKLTLPERVVVSIIRLLLPPHADNEQAAEYLRKEIGRENDLIEWVAVRPDTLQDEEFVSRYEVVPSPTSSAIFGSRKTSRINVGHFMSKLIRDDDLWQEWKGQMPVIYYTQPD